MMFYHSHMYYGIWLKQRNQEQIKTKSHILHNSLNASTRWSQKTIVWGQKAAESSGNQSSGMHGGEGSLSMTQSVNQSQDQYL